MFYLRFAQPTFKVKMQCVLCKKYWQKEEIFFGEIRAKKIDVFERNTGESEKLKNGKKMFYTKSVPVPTYFLQKVPKVPKHITQND
jgi:hypothetical protein